MGYDSRRLRGGGRGRPGRGADRLARRHGGPVRRHPAGRGQHLDDHQRHGADPAGPVRGGRPRSRGSSRPSSAGPSRTTSSRSTSPAGRRSTRPGPSMRLVTDVFEFARPRAAASGTRSASPATTCARPGRRPPRSWRSRSRTASRTCEAAVARGLEVDDFAPRLSFFFAAWSELFEEVAKFRAARRMWARIMRDRFGASNVTFYDVPVPHADGRRPR